MKQTEQEALLETGEELALERGEDLTYKRNDYLAAELARWAANFNHAMETE